MVSDGDTVRSTSSYDNPYGYTSRRHDEESGLMYFRARQFNPLTGEFVSQDPLAMIDGSSVYQCIYDENFKLITEPPDAGTVDLHKSGSFEHYYHDVKPVTVANSLDKGKTGRWTNITGVIGGMVWMKNPPGENVLEYYKVRPSWHKDCPKNPS